MKQRKGGPNRADVGARITNPRQLLRARRSQMPTSAKSGSRYTSHRSTDFAEVRTISGLPTRRRLDSFHYLYNSA